MSKYKKYSTLVGGMLLMFCLGSVSSLATMSPYYMSYLREYDEFKLVRYSQTIWLQTILTIFISISAISCSILKNRFKFGTKPPAILGSLFMSAGYALCYFSIKTNLPIFSITYSMLYGYGYGLTYIVPISMAMKWFPKSKATATAFVLLGLGAGGCFFNEFSSLYINPHNYSPDEPYDAQHQLERYFSKKLHSDLLERVPRAFLFMGGILLGVSILALLIMFEPNEDQLIAESEAIINDRSEFQRHNQDENEEKLKEESKVLLTFKQAIKRHEVYMFAILSSFFNVSLIIFLTNYKLYGQTFIHDDHFLTNIATINAVVNIFTRFIWGIVFDKISFKLGYLILNTCSMTVVLTVGVNELIKNKIVYLLWCMAGSFIETGILILIPTGYAKTFGQKNIVLLYGLCAIISIPASVSQSLLSSLANQLGYFVLFCIACSFSAIAWFVAAVFFHVKNEDGEDI